ncbi:outer membrane protein [Polynucleobacter brandtiae]|uniref:Outer membrane protein n=2 Tax=Polynucleobacter brandtiae TaxID=1938816 RepID=A0A2M8VIL7_9BURK|nr:outer membrane protein [Polynucleobacter brandtiae]
MTLKKLRLATRKRLAQLPLIFLLLVFPMLSNAMTLEGLDESTTLPNRIVGDIGGAVYSTNLNIGSYGPQTAVLPYGFFDYKRLAVRIDQIAFKTIKLGAGHLEIVGKVDPDTYKVKSVINGQTINKGYQAPIGLGTFQETDMGIFMLNLYHDFGKSRGNLLEFNYFGEVELIDQIKIYPQLGIEQQSSSYANYYYGITSEEALQTGYQAFNAKTSTNPLAGFLLEIPVVDDWYLNLYGKRKWLGNGVGNSPVLTKSFQDTVFVGLAYRFK